MIGRLLLALAGPTARWLLPVLVPVLVIVGCGAYLWHSAGTRAREQAQAEQATKDTALALARARAAAADAQAALALVRATAAADAQALAGLARRNTAQTAALADLNGRLPHVQLIATAAPVACAPVTSEESGLGPAASAAGPLAAPAAADGPWLTAGAVRLWNGALYLGEPHAPELAASACGADAAAGATCAADAATTGTSLADAWANHIANAASCAADRARHADLINAVRQREAALASAAAALQQPSKGLEP